MAGIIQPGNLLFPSLGAGQGNAIAVGTLPSSGLVGSSSGGSSVGDSRALAALTYEFDDLANASGLGAPAIVRGCVAAHLATGLVVGAGQTTAVRTSNLTALQAAVTYAATNNKWFEIEPNTYEIYGSAGLVIPVSSGSFEWRGTLASQITQYYSNAPILTIGGVSGTAYSGFQRIDGFSIDYGVSQTGNALASALRFGASFGTIIENFQIGTVTGTLSNKCFDITSTNTSNNFFFQNVMRDGHIYGAQTNLFNWTIGGTGNLLSNLYFHNGANRASALACSGPAVNMVISGQAGDNVIERMNIEHVNSNTILQLGAFLNTTFIGTHFEDIGLTGGSPYLVNQVSGQIKMIETMVYNVTFVSGASGTASMFGTAGYGEVQSLSGLSFKWDTASLMPSAFRLVSNPSNQGNDTNPGVVVEQLMIEDDGGGNGTHMVVDQNILTPPLVNGTTLGWYQGDNLLPTTEKFQPIITAAYTHYGQHQDAVIFVPASITSFTLGLSNKFKPSGTGSSLPTPPGSRVRIRRQSGTVSGTLTVTDIGSSTTLTTNSTSATDFVYQYGATAWTVAT